MGFGNSTKVGEEMHRFFVDKRQVSELEIHIDGMDVKHIKNVLRMKIDEEIVVSDGDNLEYTCFIKQITDDEVIAQIKDIQKVGLELKSQIYLFQGLPKSDKMEVIIQKAVELGVYQVIPVAMKRCVVKYDSKKEATKLKRWQEIAKSAAKQAKRMIIPKVQAIQSFEEALAMASKLNICLLPYELAVNIEDTKTVLSNIKPGESIGVFIGPEGGFAETEVADAIASGAQAITLGKRILRTETAGLAMLSILMFLMEEA